MHPRQLLEEMFEAAVAAASGESRMAALPLPALPRGVTATIAIGTAAAAMAARACHRLPPGSPGLVVTRTGHLTPAGSLPASFEVIEAGHPVPDSLSLHAAERALQLASSLGADDRLLMLVSGGGSALLAAPAPGLDLAEKQALTRELLSSGASIGEINVVRKHLSRIKGGRLALAAPDAALVTWVISDVPGDDPSMVASGPTLPDASTLQQARAVLDRHGVRASAAIRAALADPRNESPKRLLNPVQDVVVVARAADALEAAARVARAAGCEVDLLGDDLQGEARALGADHGGRALAQTTSRVARVTLSGGETTVRVINPRGCGGRNAEYLLALALALDGASGVWALACDTDGIDGTGANAGAVLAPDSLARARALGLDPRELLQQNRSYDFFAALGDLIVTGPTRTNVNDIRAVLMVP